MQGFQGSRRCNVVCARRWKFMAGDGGRWLRSPFGGT